MEAQELMEGNRLIAFFMGAVDETGYFQASTIGKTKVPTGRIYMTDRFPNNMHLCSLGDLIYHSSWDWLMPVVEKIESIEDAHHGYFGVHISSNGCTIQATNLRTDKPIADPPHYFNDVTLDTKIQSTWYAIVQFLQWYTQLNKGVSPE